ncbi:MAG: peptide-methionine (S)-S-oxide reductase [Bacillota bacterium]|nr:peptide-methionine (S)-S-oxide reductase [Bacillota bacterium]
MLPGVLRTRVGYAGGVKVNPTYRSLGDHTETFQVDYDPATVSYQELLKVFWEEHNPTTPAWSKQYMAIVFTHNEEQNRLAYESKEAEEVNRKNKIYTEIRNASRFFLAEDYHQKYYLQKVIKLMNEYRTIYPSFSDLISSRAVARANGYVAGYGDAAMLASDSDKLGLSPHGVKILSRFVK